MNIWKRILALTGAASMGLMLMTGCSADDTAVARALLTRDPVKSMHFTADVRMNIQTGQAPDALPSATGAALAMLSDMKIHLDGTSSMTSDTAGEHQVRMDLDMSGLSTSMNLWMKQRSAQDVLVVAKVPAFYRGMIPGMGQREYLMLDTGAMMKSLPGGASAMTSTLDAASLHTAMKAATEAFITHYKGTDLFVKNGTKVVGGDTVNVYKVNLTLETLQNIWKDLEKNLDNNALKAELKVVYENWKKSLSGDQSADMPDFDTAWSQAREMLTGMEKTLDNDPGESSSFALQVGINTAGQVAWMRMDASFASPAAGGTVTGTDKPATISFSMEEAIDSINKPVTITWPALTPANSMSYEELMKAAMPSPMPTPGNSKTLSPDEPALVLDGKLVRTSLPVVVEDGTSYVALRDLSVATGEALSWNSEQNCAELQTGLGMMKLRENEHSLNLNGKDIPLKKPVRVINNRTYVPVRGYFEALGATVKYESSIPAVIITTTTKGSL